MSKRFTDSNKWRDAWYSQLSDNNKFLWLYLLDVCDHAGIWEVNVKQAESDLWAGCLDEMEEFGGRIEQLTPNHWYIPKFVRFQYGDFQEDSRVHRGVLKVLERFGLSWPDDTPLMGLNNPIDTQPIGVRIKVKDKDKEKDYTAFDEFWNSYPKKSGKLAARKEFEKAKLGNQLQEVLEALERYKKESRVLKGFILDPERWIKKGCWMDEGSGSGQVDEIEEARARTQRWIEKTGGKR